MKASIGLCLLGLLMLSELSASAANAVSNYSFAIDYDNDQFLLDGKPFRFVAGSFHYFRAPRQSWRDILRKMRAGGLNAVTTYVEWSMHEPEPNKWVWDGDANIIEFIETARQEDLLVILRPGPYICAERDFGGFPYWLLNFVPDIKLRTKDERYIHFAERYLEQILTRVKPYLRGNGGPVIMVQVENEYGSFYSCDNVYKRKMFEFFDRHVGKDAVLFTTDGPTRQMLQCGTIPGVFTTIDFGSGANVDYNYKILRQYQPKGPLVNSEYYPGWLTHWAEPFQRVDANNVVKTLDKMLSLNVSVNFYMFFGGTNFGFTSGANMGPNYQPQLTSYDYDAPITEAGDLTPKYFQIRDTIAKHLPLPSIKVPPTLPKRDYGAITMEPMLDLFTEQARITFGTPRLQYPEPPPFEFLGQPNWLVLYETKLPSATGEYKLNATVKDRALVYVDDKLSGEMNRMDKGYTLNVRGQGDRLKMLVENMGHVNYGSVDVEDFKGIWNAKVNDATLGPWTATGFKLSSVDDSNLTVRNTRGQTGKLHDGPQFLVGYFEVEGELRDSFLNTQGWGKGAAYVNGRNLGRYWPKVGPQMTLYVPAAYLKQGRNILVLVELENVPENRVIKFQVTPDLG